MVFGRHLWRTPITDEPQANLKSEPTPGPYYYKPVERGTHEAGTYHYKPVESAAAVSGAVAAPTTNYESSSSSSSSSHAGPPTSYVSSSIKVTGLSVVFN